MPRDTLATAALWRRFAADASADAFDALVTHYLPLVRINAADLKRRRPEFYADPLDDLISDGTVGLMKAVRTYANARPAGFQYFARRAVRGEIRRQTLARSPGGRVRRERLIQAENVRAALVQQLGRLPTPAEMGGAVAALFTNPLLYVDAANDRASREPDPDGPALDAEVVRLAARGLKGADRVILRMALSGHSPAEIGRRVGVGREMASLRVNGVLWQARCNAALAAYLDVRPAVMPPHTNLKQLPRVAGLPPALRVG